MVSIILMICGFMTLSGCGQSALMQMQQGIDRREQRIGEKERQILELEREEKALLEVKQRLLSDLAAGKMSLNQLSSKLESLRRENDRTLNETGRQKKERKRLDSKIGYFQDQLKELQMQNSPNEEEKLKKIETLKKEIEAYLKIGLH